MVISWTGYAQPTTQASNIVIRPVSGQTNQLTFSWAAGNPANKVLVVVSTADVVFIPANDMSYPVSTNFTSGTDIDGGAPGKAVAVYSNTGSTSVTVQDLPSNADYRIQIFEYTDASSNELYNINGAADNPLYFKAFTSPGTTPWITPAGVTAATVQIWGAGAGGGGVNGGSTRAGGGGGGGAYVYSPNTAVAGSIDVTVGSGGSGGVGNNSGDTNGEDGEDSSFGTLIASGGAGGATGGIAVGLGSGGAGGDVNGAGNFDGGAGMGGSTTAPAGGGGGGGAGNGAAGNATSPSGGTGANGGGNGGNGATTSGNGGNGVFPGGGGGGGYDNTNNDANNRSGGSGANGIVIVSYSIPAIPSGLDLAAADDLGASDSDNITSKDDLTINGTGTPGSTIQLFNSGTPIGSTTTVLVDGTWSIELSDLAEGDYELTATATMGGNTSAASTPLEILVDLTAPTVVISSDDANGIVRDADNVTITVELSEDLGTPTIDIGTAGSLVDDGVMTNTDPGPPVVWTYDWDVPTGNDGSHPVTINLASTEDVAGNAVIISGLTSFTIDNTAPVITNVSIPDAPMKIGDVVSATITVDDDGGQTYTLVSGSIGGFTLGSLSRTNNTTYTAEFTISEGGSDVAAGSDIPVSNLVLADPANNESSAYTTPISQSGDPIDATSPTLVITRNAVTLGSFTGTTDNSISFNLAFSELMDNSSFVDTDDIIITHGGTTASSSNALTTSDNQTYTFTLNNVTGNGAITITVGPDIADEAGNAMTAAEGPSQSFTIDNNAPQVTSIVRQSPTTSTTNADVLVWDVTFSEPVANVSAADFVVSGTTATVASALDQGSNVYRVTVSGGDLANLEATVTLSFAGTQDITDAAGNALTDTNPTGTNNNTFDLDNTAPRISSIVRQSPSSSPTNANTLVWDVTFNEEIINIDATDFSVTGTTATITNVQDQGANVFRVTVSGGNLAALNATVTLNISGTQNITDVAGNELTNPTPLGTNNNTFVVDNAAPSVSITRQTVTAPTSLSTVYFIVDFNEPVDNADNAANYVIGAASTVSGGVIGATVTANSSTQYVVEVTSYTGQAAPGAIYPVLDLDFSGTHNIADKAGNAFAGDITLEEQFEIDNTSPTLADGEFTLNLNGGAAETITFTINETLDYPDQADITGFLVNGMPVGSGNFASAKYTLATNTITLTSTADNSWNAGATVSYTPGTASEVKDFVGLTMASIPSTPVTIQVISLQAGDIAFTAFNSDPDDNSNEDDIDGFSFVLLKDISSGTVIKFTDNGWSGDGTPALTTDESTITWTATSAMQAGTEITIVENPINVLTSTHGSVSIINGPLSFYSGGDQIIAYQGASNNPTFIAGLHNSNSGTEDATLWNVITDVDDDNARSALPPGLTNGVNAISFSAGRNKNAQYKTTGVTLTGSPQQLRASMNNVANWNRRNNAAYPLTNGVNKFPVRPVITNVSIPNGTNYIVSSTPYTATITVHDDRDMPHTLLSSNIGNYTLSNLVRVNSTTYTAQFTVAEGGNDYAANADIPLSVNLQSSQGNATSSASVMNSVTPFTTAIAQANDPVDGNSPKVLSITRASANPNNTSSVNFTVTFSETIDVTSLNASDFTLSVSGVTGATITGISPLTNSDTYTVTVGSYSGSGTIGLNYVDSENSNAIRDVAGNYTITSTTNSDGSFEGEVYTIFQPEPSAHVTNFEVSSVTSSTITLTWIDVSASPVPTGYVISVERSGAVAPPPADFGVPVTEETDLINNTIGYMIVGPGVQTAVFNTLLSGTTYTFKIYPYTNSGSNIDFKIDNPPTDSETTPTAELSAIILNSSPVSISSILDGDSDNNGSLDDAGKATVMQFTIYDDGQDPIVPNIMVLNSNGDAPETVVFNLREALVNPTTGVLLANNTLLNTSWFTSSTGSIVSARYNTDGSSNHTITLTSNINNIWTPSATTISYNATIGTLTFATLGKVQAINAHAISYSSTSPKNVVEVFTLSGSKTWTVPLGVTSITVEAWGAGGGGGSGLGSSCWDGGGGGGSGAYSSSVISVVPGTTYNVTVGTGGTTNLTLGGYASSGTASSFGAIVIAPGGFGGQTNTGGDAGSGGSGGNVGTGDFVLAGTSGNSGSLGSCSAPPSFYGSGGNGGSAPNGGGSGGPGNQTGTGQNGSVPGGGGGGTANGSGGNGARGEVKISYTLPATAPLSDFAADNAPLKFSQLVITQGVGNSAALSNWQDIIAGAELFDGTNAVTGTVNANNITFASIPSSTSTDLGYISDADATHSSKTYTLRVWLRDDLNNTLATTVDGMNLAFNLDLTNPATLTYDDTSNGNQTSSRLVSGHPALQSGANPINVIATQLDFTTSPDPTQFVLTNVTSTSAAPDNSTVPVIRARDINGNTDLNYNATISLTNAGTIPTSQSTVTMTSGRANFPAGFQYQNAGDGTLTASTSTVAANGLAPANGVSGAVTVEFGALSTMAVVSTNVISTNSFYAIPFTFSITDDNGVGGDGAPTRITQLKITKKSSGNEIPDWRDILDVDNVNNNGPAFLYDGSSSYLNLDVLVEEDAIIFSNMLTSPTSGAGFIADGQTKTYQLYLLLKPSFGGTLPATVDHMNFDFEILPSDIQFDSQSSRMSTAQAAISSGPIDVDVDAAELRFTIQPPADVLVNADLTTSPVVEAVDKISPLLSGGFYYPYGNRDLDFTESPTITNAGSLNMINMPSAFTEGLLSFPANFRYTETGDGTLNVAATGVTAASSDDVNVRVGISGTITAGAGPEPATISSLADTDGEKVQVFDFTISDDDGSENDGNPTLITGIVITQPGAPNNTITEWADAIAAAELFDGTNTITGTVNSTNITFSSISIDPGDPGYIADDASKTYRLRIYLRSSLGGTLPSTIDGLQFGFQVRAADIVTDAAGSSIISTEELIPATGTEVTVDATQLDFTNAPPGASINTNIVPTLQVEARDENGNRDLDFTGPDTEITDFTALVSVVNPPLENNPGHVFTNGVYVFPSDFQYTSELLAPNPNESRDGNLHMEAGKNSKPSLSGDSPDIDITSSSESTLSFSDPSDFTYNTNLPYISYQDNSNMIPLASFVLTDGNGITQDTDGAPTSINSITFEVLTNGNPGSSDIRNLALFDKSGTLVASQLLSGNTITFSGLSGITTGLDDGAFGYAPVTFTIRASFKNTAADVHDHDQIQLRIANVIMNGGSQLNPSGSVTGANINPVTGVVDNAPFTPSTVNFVDVVATRLDFTSQPEAFEGIQQPLAVEPVIQARDANGVIDLDHNFTATLSTAGANLSSNSVTFVNGQVQLTGIQYTSTGNGTLTITSNGLSSDAGGSTPCSHVDVINVFTTLTSGTGVVTTQNLPGGAINRVIFGVRFNTPYNAAGEPKLDRFTINFSNPIVGVFNNIRVFESANESYDGTDPDVTTLGAVLTPGPTSLIIDLPGAGRDLSTPVSYFLMVDVAETASGSTPSIQPFVVNNSTNIITTEGSVYGTNTEGQVYTFASIFPPTLVSSYPAAGQLNVDPNQPTLELTFSVPVWTLDGQITLTEKGSGTSVTLNALNGNYNGGDPTTLAQPLTFALPPLEADKVYYVTIPPGQKPPVNIGIMDESNNVFPGITYSGTLYFKTANPNPPELLEASITNAGPTGAVINATFNQRGKAYFLVVADGDPAPSTSQIKDPVAGSYAGTAIAFGDFEFTQTNNVSQFGLINANLNLNTTYDVWMYAENDALPVPFATTTPYGANFIEGSAGPTLSFTTPASTPSAGPIVSGFSFCENSYQPLNAPILIVESTNSDFANAGTQTFNLLLPSGFQFDVSLDEFNNPLHGKLILSGNDFTGSGSLQFINASTLRVSFVNTTSTSLDKIAITDLRIIASKGASGNIIRLGGNALTTLMPELTPVATLSSFDASNLILSSNFTNSYTRDAYNNDLVTTIPDNYNAPSFNVELIPLLDDDDFGPSIFTGQGVNVNQLNLSGVPKSIPFNITHVHVDNNGCTSEYKAQYTVYDHTTAIGGLSPTFCLENDNFPLPAIEGEVVLSVPFTSLPAHYMTELTASIPFDASPDQIIYGTSWANLLQSLPEIVQDYDPGTGFDEARDYIIDGAKILNAHISSGGAIPNPYSNFIETSPQNNTYYRGGSLGFIEFTGSYQNVANQSVRLPIKQNVEFFVPAVPIVEVGQSNQSFLDENDPLNPVGTGGFSNKGTPVFCIEGGNISINGWPNAAVGSSRGSFTLWDVSSGTQIPLPPDANLEDHGFIDNGNGTAILNPKKITNGFNDIRIVYTYKEDNSPCESTGSQIIRIEPNPVAVLTAVSEISPNTPVGTAYCEGKSISFDGSGSSIEKGTIALYSWNFDDAINSTGSTNSNEATGVTASHIFVQSAAYRPTLTVTSTYNCKSNAEFIDIGVGSIPDAQFTFEGVSIADDIAFTNTSTFTSVTDQFKELVWNYGVAGAVETVTSNFNESVTHNYPQAGKYEVNLHVTSEIGCANEISHTIIIVPHVSVTDVNVYEENFETDDGGWQHNGLSGSTSSWAHGSPDNSATKPIQLIAENGSGVWETNLNGPYNPIEKSALYSPSFDLRALDRPMIQFNHFTHLAAGEGVVIEYSTDNKNVADPTKQWSVLGEVGSGVEWYDANGLSSQPGFANTTGLGWTGTETQWKLSKHVLDPVLHAERVVFRYAIATLTANPALDGFAIDNVRVGNRTRVVLVENFRNLGNTTEETRGNTTVNVERAETNFFNQEFGEFEEETSVVRINYHVRFPNADPLNKDNEQDPGARALYYGVSQTPRARMDGTQPTGATYFSAWGIGEYNERSLKLADAEIHALIEDNTDGNGNPGVRVTVKALKDLGPRTVLHIAIVEKSISSSSLSADMQQLIRTGETQFDYVLKKMLPNAAGTNFGTTLPNQETRVFPSATDYFVWSGGAKLYAPSDDLALVVFLQDEDTREVYQTAIIDLNDPSIVTGIEDPGNTSFRVHPSPADRYITVELPEVPTVTTPMQMFDQMGKLVHESSFEKGISSKTIDTDHLAGGVYLIQVESQKGILRKKVLVLHRN